MVTAVLSAQLNLLRWIAAFMVVISHIRPLLFVEYAEVENKGSIAIKIFYFITGFGHEAVVIFFVISGLLVGGVSARKYLDGHFSARDYLIHRFARIYIVLIPALVVSYILDKFGIAYLDATGIYSHTTLYRFSGNVIDRLDPGIALGNVLMLQEVLVPALGSNGPLWSLSYEWWYYMLFLCVLQIAPCRRNPAAAAIFATIALLLLYLLPLPILLWSLLWLAGVAVAVSPVRSIRISLPLAYGLFAAALLWSRFDSIYTEVHTMYTTFRRDCVIAAACYLLFSALSQRGEIKPRFARLNAALADFSYTTYLVHVPFLLFVVASLNVFFGIPFHRQPAPDGFLYFMLLLALIYLYSYLFSRITERHTGTLRRKLDGMIGIRRPAVVADNTQARPLE